MKAFSVLSFASTAFAAISNVQLFASSDDSTIDGQGLTSTHEGAGINYLFLGPNAQTLQYDSDDQTIFTDLQIAGGQTARQSFVVEGGIFQLSVSGTPLTVQIQPDGTVSFPGSDSVFASKNINDPNNFSATQFAVIDHATNETIPFTIVAKLLNNATAPSNETTSVITTFEGAAATNVGYGAVGVAAVLAGLIL
ncbi:RHD3 Cell wall protein RHD3 [Candida maltosa Xu316]|uniref:Putative cell wall protein, putative n=1 Tax=Candida maltosa (strain Xu316) TaxID=1245528 RepID=M3HLL7_CANMX|nr:putative cell wall protein, putative [Candida maltosa Xu316]